MKNSKAASTTQTPPEGTELTPSTRTNSAFDEIRKFLKPVASLQATVVLFFFALVLVFFGTLAQMNEGIWTVVDKYFRSGIVWVPLQLIAKFGMIFFELHPKTHWNGSFPLPGGYLLGWLLLINLLAAHLVRFRVSWKRAGIIITHLGVVVLLVGEFITRECAVESTMTLATGETGDFVDETLSVELAITKPIDAKNNEVVKVPGARLKHKGLIVHDELPVDIEVLEYWKNSSFEVRGGPAPDDSWVALQEGFRGKLNSRSEESGVDSNQRGDAPAVRVNLRKKGTNESVGQFLLSIWYYPNSTINSRKFVVRPFKFTVDGQEYTIELRNKRSYKPYSIHLLKFEHALYPGTDIPKDFASTVEINDPQEGLDREYRIYMNNPLRYRDNSYYQLMVLGADTGTVLQVVRNPGRVMPYIGWMLVSLGLIIHFLMNLTRFLNKPSPTKGAELPNQLLKFQLPPICNYLVPAAVVLLAGGWLASKAIPPSHDPEKIDYYEIGQLPVLQGGRLKPLDTVARTNLQAISGKSEVQDEKKQVVASAVQWYVDVFDSRRIFEGKASEYKVFRIDNDQLLTLLSLQPRPEFFRYSLAEIEPKYKVLREELKKIQDSGDKKLNLRDTKIVDLGKKIDLYQQLVHGRIPALVPPQSDGAEWQTMEAIDEQVGFSEDERATADQQAAEVVIEVLNRQGKPIKDLNPRELRAAQQMAEQLARQILADKSPDRREQVSPAAAAFTHMMRIATAGNVQALNESFSQLKSEYYKRISADQWVDMRIEAIYNHFAPFYLLSFLYVFVIILACLSWLGFRKPLGEAAYWLGVLTLLLHAAAIITRMYLQGRPPVTNLYSSAVFIGWGCMALCLVLERIFRNGIGIVVGSALGALTMMVAHHLAEGGDTMEMLQAVLDTDFWLATHVTAVTLGYTATFVAGFIAILCVLASVVFSTLQWLGAGDAADSEGFKKICYRMIYGVVCFATLLSFMGTVLGGLWADYSWGRFWGWDAKENGAVMVVIWNTLILHARWAGLIKLRGMTILTLIGNMITFWSWFGTNQLGAGLHAYGFNTELAKRCFYVWVCSIPIICVAALPLPFWSDSKRPGKQLAS